MTKAVIIGFFIRVIANIIASETKRGTLSINAIKINKTATPKAELNQFTLSLVQ